MSFYVIVAATTAGNPDPSGTTSVKAVIYDDDVLPVFSSLESLWRFVGSSHSANNLVRPVPHKVNPVELAVMVEQWQARGLRYLVFDPASASAGRWQSAKKPMSVSAYRRYIVELAREVKKLRAEGEARFGDRFSGRDGRQELLAWCALRAKEVTANARARAGEWETEDDSWYEDPDPPVRW